MEATSSGNVVSQYARLKHIFKMFSSLKSSELGCRSMGDRTRQCRLQCCRAIQTASTADFPTTRLNRRASLRYLSDTTPCEWLHASHFTEQRCGARRDVRLVSWLIEQGLRHARASVTLSRCLGSHDTQLRLSSLQTPPKAATTEHRALRFFPRHFSCVSSCDSSATCMLIW